jgi:2-phosphosulfolactate phosphatase
VAISHYSIEVIFSPALYESRQTKKNFVVVIVDILRATTTICSAFHFGVEKIIPVASIVEAIQFKKKGFLIAGERDGKKLDIADFGNSPLDFTEDKVKGKTLVFTSTNGTRTLETASGAEMIAIGAFTNISFLTEWLLTLNRNVVILCSGWKDTFSLEDASFAGALTESLIEQSGNFILSDSAIAALEIWRSAKRDPADFLRKGSHYKRLMESGEQDVSDYAVSFNSTRVVPLLENYYLLNILK